VIRKKHLLVLSCLFVWGFALGPVLAAEKARKTGGAEKADASLGRASTDSFLPEWFDWGADLRLRLVYFRNAVDFESSAFDTRFFWRTRARLWAKFGPFFEEETLDKENGLFFYARLTTEPRFFMVGAEPTTQRDEGVWDNLYVEWKRIFGAPISLKVGRQDMIYGKAFVMIDGTPLDGSTTVYMDAVKATLHLDDVQTQIDVFGINNKGTEDRLDPINHSERWSVSEFDTKAFGVYAINKSIKDQEFHTYYIYKDEEGIRDHAPNDPNLDGRNVQTLGFLGQGKCCVNWDYYGEIAFQWGEDAKRRIEALGMQGEIGYTFKETPWTPRVLCAYTFLSGDDPDTPGEYEGWDPVFSRWPQWSELLLYRFAAENARLGNFTNLHRVCLGVDVKPNRTLTWLNEFNLLLADEHSNGTAAPYNTGYTRGYLARSILKFKINKWCNGHLIGEYFIPGSYYDDGADEAFFIRWNLEFKVN